jgi:hypothetical protein
MKIGSFLSAIEWGPDDGLSVQALEHPHFYKLSNTV